MNFIKNMDQKLVKKLGIIIGGVVGIFILLIIIILIINSRLSYSDIELRMVRSAKSYYVNHPSELPKMDNGTVAITAAKLAEEGYMKPLEKLVKNKEDICTGEVIITKNEEFLLYEANLDCGKSYKTKKLKNIIAEKVVENGDGVYKDGESYIYKGDKVDNFVSYANKLWRIIRVNNDGSIRMIEITSRDPIEWDDRYNSQKDDNIGINDYRVSRVKDYIDDIYKDEEEFTDSDKSYLIKTNLCIGKRNEDEKKNDGSIECSTTFENQSLGLLQVNEFALASLSTSCKVPENPNCGNYNYLADINSFWTLTADKKTSYRVFKVSGTPFLTDAYNYAPIKLVVNINSQVNYVSGDGTEENPYTFN